MKQLIDLFNKKYGSVYGVIDDSFSNEDTYKIYKIIKTLCSDDKEIMTVLEKVKLPEPKTAKESIEKININVSGGIGNDNVPHYNKALIYEIHGEDFNNLMNNNYFNINALVLDETKLYVSEAKTDINNDDSEEFSFKFVYDKENDMLVDEYNEVYISNHKSYDGANFIENENSAVISFFITTMNIVFEGNGYLKLYEVDKVELDNNCLSDDVKIKNSLTVGSRIGDIGKYSVAEGVGTVASGYGSHTEGNGTTASGIYSHAEGNYTTASGYYSHAEGNNTKASGQYSHAEGVTTTASGQYSHAEGYNTTASGEDSHVEGKSSNLATDIIQDLSSSTTKDSIITAWNSNKFSLAKGNSSHVEGMDNLALGDSSHAEGFDTTANGEYSHAEGRYTTASGDYSHAEGRDTTASGNHSHVEGNETTASGNCSHAEGEHTEAIGESSHAEGYYAIVSGNYSHAEGSFTTASGSSSHAEGKFTTSLGANSHIEGSSSNSVTSVIRDLSSSTSDDSIITAWNSNKFSLTKGTASHVEGFNCLALDNYSHAEGNATQALYQGSHAEGTNTVASSICSHAEGYETIASGGYSHAEGSITKATELYSHAEGNYSKASGNTSHAEGHETIASGEYSHAEGYKCKSESNSSHAEGCLTEANNFYTHAEGFYTIAKGYSQHVQGKCNIEDTTGKYAHIVGNGESETERSNAHTLDWEGNAWYAGKLTQEGTPTEDKDLVTKKYVDEKTASIDTTINNTLPSNGLLTLTTDKIQTTTLAVPTDITLPTVTGYTEIHLFFEGSEGVTITTGTTTVRWKTSPTISTGNLYEIVFTYINDTIGWIGDCLSYSA